MESWSQDEKLLAAGAGVVAELRAAVKQKLGYSCSAGKRREVGSTLCVCMRG